MPNKTDLWQFWIDVGGTFTDCLGFSPTGQRFRIKVLSSARSKFSLDRIQHSREIFAHQRPDNLFPDNFWRGYRADLFDAVGELKASRQVIAHSAALHSFTLDEPLEPLHCRDCSFEIVSPEIAPLLAIRQLLKIPLDVQIPTCRIRLGTTRGTNALLTRTGARTAFVTTRGLGDSLLIGNQDRPKLFELDIRKHPVLFETVLEIDERISHDGQILGSVDSEVVQRELQQLYNSGIRSLAICLMHAYRFPQHEQQIAEIAQQIGFDNISLSHQVAALAKFISRAETTVLDAYLNPVLNSYLDRLRHKLGPGSELKVINSEGALMQTELFTGKDSVLSGPAGGVIGFSETAKQAGFARSIGFDMGGTSTDVARYDGVLRYERESMKSNVRIITPVLAIETVAAGGGSVCHFDGARLLVGPASAGADPGPACYGRGGPLTVTDLNLYLGRLSPSLFPFALQRNAVSAALEKIQTQVRIQSGTDYSLIELAEAFLQIANANMASAIRTISVADGFDPREYTLVAFGGAAAQHACAVADELEITRVLIHPDASILSAHGIGLASISRQHVRGIYQPLEQLTWSELNSNFAAIRATVLTEMQQQQATEDLSDAYWADLRYQGTEPFLSLNVNAFFAEWNPMLPNAIAHANFHQQIRAQFQTEHQRRYGYTQERALEVASLRVITTSAGPNESHVAPETPRHYVEFADGEPNRLSFNGVEIDCRIILRERLRAGDRVVGPALITDPFSTIFVQPGWQADTLTDLQLLLQTDSQCGSTSVSQIGANSISTNDAHVSPNKHASPSDLAAQMTQVCDPKLLEIFNNQFASIARQMGLSLQNTAVSVNVKERLDFSCAIFDAGGSLVVNAPHIPVHLGAMSETIKFVISDNPHMQPQDIYVTNDPYRGGSHLPDVTVVMPVFGDEGLRFFLASRAHHAEIGGITPGSMPPMSRSLAEEGVLISNFLLARNGHEHFDRLGELLSSGPHPSRNVNDNLADVRAQVAANQQGINGLQDLITRYSWPTVAAYMKFIQAAAEQKTRNVIRQIPDGRYAFADALDNGAKIAVTINVLGSDLEFDFSETDPVREDNFNANTGIVSAAIIYCLRCLIKDEIPLNAGLMHPVIIRLPASLLNPPVGNSPQTSPAVVAGNVETSQRIVDVIFGALGICAASQGTMNNLIFGDQSFGYYETICGGAGATRNAHGASAVHTHMTNTRMTDPEILEQRFPVRLEQFSIRNHSGGQGKFRGGDGVVRRLRFLRELEVAILSSRRAPYHPFGIDGGQPGACGENLLIRNGGEPESIRGCQQLRVQVGDQLIIKTPGGGGRGSITST
jgi:5-oxoprolinase (ATP-hydrolysing)